MRKFVLLINAGSVILLQSISATAGVNVLTYHNDNSRAGANLSEKTLTPANVNQNKFGKLFGYDVDGYVYAQPLYVSGLTMPGEGTRNVVFVATEHNSVYAFDADSNAGPSGGLLWQVNLGTPGLSASGDFGTRYGPYESIVPEVGVTGTPVIDLASKTLYVDTFVHEASGYSHKLHALDITTGAERSFSPVVVRASVMGSGVDSTNGVVRFNALQQLQRAALTLAGGILYVAFGSYEDTDPYHGWIIGFNPATLAQLPSYTFNTTPNSRKSVFGVNAGEGGIWMSGCGLSEDAQGNLYFGVGNGSFNAFNHSGGTEYGDSLVKLSASGGLSVADYFTPYDQQFLADNNGDLGSTGVVLLPDQPGPFKRLMIAAGKSGAAYLMNRDMMTAGNNHFNVNGAPDAVVQKIFLANGALDTPAYFDGTIYFVPVAAPLVAYVLTNGVLPDTPTATGPRIFGYPGATPGVSGNGNQNGIVWAVQNGSPAVLTAYDAKNITTEIYSSDQAGTRDQMPNGVKFAPPTIANGKVYVGGQYGLTVFGLLGADPANSPRPGIYSGLFYESGGVEFLKSGSFNATLTKRGAFSGRLRMGAGVYPFGGRFDSNGTATATITRKGFSALTLTLEANADVLTGTVSDGTWTADLAAYRAAFNIRTNPAPYSPRYTVIVPGPADGNPDNPQGDGFGVVTVTRAGVATISGRVADGAHVTQSAWVSQNGQWPFYAPLYRGKGQILGWLSVAPDDLSGQVSWIRPAIPNAAYFPNGFEIQSQVSGSAYRRPASGTRILDFVNGALTLTDGDLTSPVSGFVTLAANNKITSTSHFSLTFTTLSGFFRGSVANPAGGKPILYSGVALQKQNIGAGFFLGTHHSGRVRLEPQ